MKFHFRLAKMLRLVEVEELAKKMEVAQVQKEIRTLEDKLVFLNSTVHSLLMRRNEDLTQRGLERYRSDKIAVDIFEIKRVEREKEVAKDTLAQRQDELLTLSRKKRALEALKEKKYLEFKSQELTREQKATEELFRNFRHGEKN